MSEEETTIKLEECLKEAIKLRLMSDVPTGSLSLVVGSIRVLSWL